MSNRSYIFAISFNPSERKIPIQENIYSISEWSSRVPISYMVMISVDTILCSSLIFNNNKPIALLANFEKGKHRLFDLLDNILRIGTFSQERLDKEIKNTKIFLNDPSRDSKYFLLELGEIFAFTDEPPDIQAEMFLKNLNNIDTIILQFLTQLKKMKSENNRINIKLKVLRSMIFKNLFSKFSNELIKQLEQKLMRNDEEFWYELGISNWSDVLYYDINSHEDDSE